MSKKVFKTCRQRFIKFVSAAVQRSLYYHESLSFENVSIADSTNYSFSIRSMGQFLEKPKVEKHNSRGKNDDIRYGLGSMQGWRVDMEDAHATILTLDDNSWSRWSYFGVFDGHAGYRTAVKAAEKLHLQILSSLNALVADNANETVPSKVISSQLDFSKFETAIKDAYFKFDHEWREENRNNNQDDKSGSTAISCLIDAERVYFLNVGDSRAILVSSEGRVLLATKDHKPSDQVERQRIQDAGGTVLIQRVNGSLAVSRALGDFEYKNNSNRRPDQQLVSPEPEVTCHSRTLTIDSNKQEEQIAFIVLACDGIWDVMTNEELAAYILGRMHVTDDLNEICNSVLDMCLYKGSKDNMSLIIIAFKTAPVPTPEWKEKDETLNTEIKKKTIEIFNLNPNRTSLDANTIWQQVVTSLNEQSSIREALPIGGGFVSKRSVFERIFDSLIKGTHQTETSSNGPFINDEHDDETHRHDDPSTNPSSADISSSTGNNLAALTQ
ncbi:unnamed protein product [Rotaria socialis]|uniref:PPM-type phosphatase domain-containing protein n=2 Tax=Rotaria socialis TaxID=392032 RepID=A0A821BJL8_9BILA|nr:unnamed protein product [Rotaria socialis]CAF4127309.1 unnamed protein product [Rotaria socialis]CAF4237341.1 unnamed protein product [Rotaria socialis]CAF4593365.1 unnamed protein product [Rotaria socialis]